MNTGKKENWLKKLFSVLFSGKKVYQKPCARCGNSTVKQLRKDLFWAEGDDVGSIVNIVAEAPGGGTLSFTDISVNSSKNGVVVICVH